MSRVLTLPLALLLMTACATIAGGGSNQSIHVESAPGAADYVIKSSSGLQMGAGRTPSTVRLPRKNEYNIDIRLAGYQPQTLALSRGTNGWIWGNLFVGWIVGFIIDFATGSAYKLEPAVVSVSLARADGDTYAVIRFYSDSNELVAERRVKMVPVE